MYVKLPPGNLNSRPLPPHIPQTLILVDPLIMSKCVDPKCICV